MKICDKCNGKSKDFKDFGIKGTVKFSDEEKELDLCQSCYFEVYKFVTGKEATDEEGMD